MTGTTLQRALFTEALVCTDALNLADGRAVIETTRGTLARDGI